MLNFTSSDSHTVEQFNRYLTYVKHLSVDLHEITENEIREVLSIETEELALFKTFVSDTKAFFSILCNKDISSVDLNEKIKAKSEQNESKVIEKPSDSKKISDQLFQIILDQTKSSLQKNMVKK